MQKVPELQRPLDNLPVLESHGLGSNACELPVHVIL